MKRLLANPILLALLLTPFALLPAAAPVCAQGIDTNNPLLPPAGVYTNPDDYHIYSSLGVILDDPAHHTFTNIVRTPVGPDELEMFDSVFEGVEVGMGLGPITLTGPVQVRTIGKVGNTTGTFDTEMVSMSLTGLTSLGPVIVRESPSFQSTGQTVIADIGGGRYHIDSFFDVFTELSVDGGASWYPCDAATRMTLVPEPATLVLLCLGAFAFCARRR